MKKYISLFVLAFVFVILFSGCGKTDRLNVDYSQYSFVNVRWMRQAEHDVETIFFGEYGSFSYSCACGNPVNDADLCEGYRYDDTTKTITLDCIEITDNMITVIKIVKCEENELHLDFNGETRIFTKT